jgi:hypothetical protein
MPDLRVEVEAHGVMLPHTEYDRMGDHPFRVMERRP